jgi:hypothetical protein
MLPFHVGPELIFEPDQILGGGGDPSPAKRHFFSASGAFGSRGIVVDVPDDSELRLAYQM